jgi:hypothetical protein
MLAGSGGQAGVSIADAAAIAGHKKTATTLRYAHAVEANLDRGIALADDLIKPSAPAEVERIGIRK